METRPSSPDQKVTRNVIIEKELSHEIIAAFFYVYNTLGYGYAEKIYSRALDIVLRRKGLRVKSSEKLTDVPKRQLCNYLTASGMRLGIVLHFDPTPSSYRVLGPHVVGRAKEDGTVLV